MRSSSIAFLVLALLTAVLLFELAHAAVRRKELASELQVQSALVKRLELTDLSLFTEARYTRHLTQADLHAPFQDFPASLEHFPSGSLVQPRRDRQERDAELD